MRSSGPPGARLAVIVQRDWTEKQEPERDQSKPRVLLSSLGKQNNPAPSHPSEGTGGSPRPAPTHPRSVPMNPRVFPGGAVFRERKLNLLEEAGEKLSRGTRIDGPVRQSHGEDKRRAISPPGSRLWR